MATLISSTVAYFGTGSQRKIVKTSSGDLLIFYRNSATTGNQPLCYRKSSDNGDTWGDEVDTTIDTNTNTFDLKIDGSDHIYIIYNYSSGYDKLYFVKLTYSEGSWSTGTPVVARESTANYLGAHFAIRSTGAFWTVGRYTTAYIVSAYSTDSGASWTPNSSIGPGADTYAVTIIPVGSEIWLFSVGNSTVSVYKTSGGNTFGTASSIGSDTVTENEYNLSVIKFSDTDIVIAAAGNNGLKSYHYNGSSWADETIYANGVYPSLCNVNGNPVCTYQDSTNSKIYYSEFTGGAWGTPVQISDDDGDAYTLSTTMESDDDYLYCGIRNSTDGDLYFAKVLINNSALSFTLDESVVLNEGIEEDITLQLDETVELNTSEQELTNLFFNLDESIICNDTDTEIAYTNVIFNLNENIVLNEALAEDITFQLDENILCNETHDEVVPQGTANYGVKIISVNPLVFVSYTSPAKITRVDVTDPENVAWSAVEITGLDYATDVVYNSTTGYVYVSGENGLVAKIELLDLNNQEIIDLSDTDNANLIATDGINSVTYIATNNAIAEIYTVDERILADVNTEFYWLAETTVDVETEFYWIQSSDVDTTFYWLANVYTDVPTEFYWLGAGATTTMLGEDDFTVYVDSVQLSAGDLLTNTISITHTAGEESTASFSLARYHDNYNTTLAGATCTIDNQNTVEVYINGELEFTGKVSDLQLGYGMDETVTVKATGTQQVDNRKTVDLALPKTTEGHGWWHLYDFTSNISNPYIDPQPESIDANPKYYNGVIVDLGEHVKQNVVRYTSFYSVKDEIDDGTFSAKPNWEYFWFATAKNFITGDEFLSTKYLGTSPQSLTSDSWNIIYLAHKYQRIYDNDVSDIGRYTLGEAPFKEISAQNGKLSTKEYWQDLDDGLYRVRDDGYNYVDYAKEIAALEYEKMQNIHGDIFPITSATFGITLTAYKYFGIKLLTRINVTQTRQSGIFKNLKGFPVGVKSINIDSGSGMVSLSADNQKSIIEIEEIDARYPDADDYIQSGVSVKQYSKFDVVKLQVVE